MRTVAHHAEALALAQKQAEDKAGQARGDVDNIAACEVERADGVADEGAVTAPNHVRQRRIHHDGPNGDERANRTILHTARKRAGDDCRGNHAECQLEDDIRHRGIAVVTQRFGCLTSDVGDQACKTDLVEASEERNRAVSAVSERPTENRPRDCNDAQDAEHHDHSVNNVLAA